MADAPKWTSDPQYYPATCWVYRKEITTITWWPHSASLGEQRQKKKTKASSRDTPLTPSHKQARSDSDSIHRTQQKKTHKGRASL